MHAKEPMYTAIVAAYNVEKYIGSCLDSILKIQDDNLEIIIVTGRKTDQTNHICPTEWCGTFKCEKLWN